MNTIQAKETPQQFKLPAKAPCSMDPQRRIISTEDGYCYAKIPL